MSFGTRATGHIATIPEPKSQKEFVDRLSQRLGYDEIADETPAPRVQAIGPGFERVPLPGFLKKDIMQTFLRDVHHYLFNVANSPRSGVTFAVQDEIRGRLVGALTDAAAHQKRPLVLLSHSRTSGRFW